MKSDATPADVQDQSAWLAATDPHTIARSLGHASVETRIAAFETLAPDKAIRVLELLETGIQAETLGRIERGLRRSLLDAMEPDDRARLLAFMSDAMSERFLEDLAPGERELTLRLLRYPKNSSGRIMSPEFVALRPEMPVSDALKVIRHHAARAETIYLMPVVDAGMRLLGTIELAKLVLSPVDARVGDLATSDVPAIDVSEDQEHAARLMRSGGLMVAPVVDRERRLVGIITFDDAMEVLEFEEGEDMARTGAAEPLGRPYLAVPVLRLVRSRIVWLSLLAVAATLTVNVLHAFEATLEQIVSLALFIPLLIGIGGNAGAQSATTIVRALAVNDIAPRDVVRVVVRESATGLTMGAVIAVATYVIVTFAFDRDLALIVATTLIAICVLATLVGSLMPIAARSISIDPAVLSAPVVTTVVDASGLLIYFLVAKAVYNL